jgi:hypothetical protein
MTSPRPLAYVFKKSAPDTVPMYRLKQKATGDWLETTSQSGIQTDTANGTFEVEGVTGYVYSTPEFGAEPLERFDNGSGWRLAFADEANGLESIGYELDGPEGYALRRYHQVGARDFSGGDPNVPQNTQGWGGDWPDLEPEIGFYDDSQPPFWRSRSSRPGVPAGAQP